MTDKVLKAYNKLVNSVANYYLGAVDIDYLMDPLRSLGAMYGIDVDAYERELIARNDIQGVADGMRGDDLMEVRVAGTLAQNLSDISACVYDVESALRMADTIGLMLGTILIIKELDNAH